MSKELPIEIDKESETPDPDEFSYDETPVITQPYDLIIKTLADQIASSNIVLKPSFQRGYVWRTPMASRLIESIFMNVPIPPCYLSQNADFELDVIDGQQRLMTIHRYYDNQFALTDLKVLKSLNGKRFFELSPRLQRQFETHTIRCISVNNKTEPNVKFEVFERLNTNTMPLNAQELRNSVYRGPLNDLLKLLAADKRWLGLINRKSPDSRMGGEELILRFFAFYLTGLDDYHTPLKFWLNDLAKRGRSFDEFKIDLLQSVFSNVLDVCTIWFDPGDAFRKKDSKAINKGLFDLISTTAAIIDTETAALKRMEFRKAYYDLLDDPDYLDVVSRSIDHKKRTLERFRIWREQVYPVLGIN